MSLVIVVNLLHYATLVRDVSQPSTLDANFVTDYMLQYDRQMQSPIIEPYVKQYTLDKGTGSVPFRCVSSSPISWYREENSPWTSTVQATCSSASNQSNGSHCASIAFTNASIEQVGRYYCAKDAEVRQYREQYGWTKDEMLRIHLPDLEAEFHATSFYLFVEDPEQPLVPGNKITSIGYILHVPCKPTSARAEVELIDMDVNATLQTTHGKYKSRVTRTQLADIKELVIESATVEHSGTYRCKTPTRTHSNITYFSSVKLYVLNSTEDFIYFSEGNTNATTIRVPKEFRTDGHSKPVTIAINYEYYAAEVNCSWFRDGTPTEALCGNCSERYEIQHKWRRDSLTILHPTIWESGRYTVECRVGNGIRRNTSRDVFIEAKAILNGKIITTVLVIAALGVLLFIGIVWGYRKYTEGKVKLSKDGTESMDGADSDRVDFLPDVYKIPREQVQLCERLGQGEFGITWMAKVSGMSEDPSLETVVAVKETKERNDRQMLVMLVSELKVHVHAGHHLNVVNLLGAVIDNVSEGELLLVMEYCRFGDMKHFLQQNRPYFENNADDGLFGSAAPDSTSTSSAVGYPFSTTDLLYWASQIACGMDYLGTSGLIHGDLAARNVLLCEGSIVKIGDFGMARVTRRDDVYRKSDSNARLPLAWMAVESLRDRIFSSSSDVWAYGVLLWELFTLGTEPYSTLLVNETILDLLTQGYRMQKPEYASTDVYSVMRNCWEEDPCARPTFKDLFTEFNNRLPNRLRKVRMPNG
ncbi:hypothetical protein ZHAS_00002717 [Anopheles sinensis]|uniref:Receptor protein-tyrosine kinase n=1 Tax=Anopheles sinensis TaxID=74873 RepID=A0A084VCV3_ANOSI|nr:hypothetical protein ZHAS_00002717 [Anopheles sinensis]